VTTFVHLLVSVVWLVMVFVVVMKLGHIWIRGAEINERTE